jgi:hypothetical protein
MELFLLNIVGIIMIYAGYIGIQTYARSFYDDPKATLSADMLLAMLSGPGVVPVVICVTFMFVGLWFIGMTLFAMILFVYTVATNITGTL